MKTVVISGALANKPFNGGNAWSRLSWILGFRQLGFDVCFVEQLSADACVDRQGATTEFEHSANLDYFRAVMDQFGLSVKSSLICGDGERVYGVPLGQLGLLAREACLLFNLSGHLTLPEIKGPIACKIYYDDDPGYTQFWEASGDSGPRLAGHDLFFTLGRNIGNPDCPIPVGSTSWLPTRPPVTLNDWPSVHPVNSNHFTTVASWRGAYGSAYFEGKTYGQKAHEFRKFITLPQRSAASFEIALQIHPGDKKDLDALQTGGWHIVDPLPKTQSPDAFRDYVQSSSAEFSVAQGVYVETQSGWFSDRTVRYLASGRPALVQDTGLADHYPIGNGLLTFRTLEEARDGADRIQADYAKHCQSARHLAEAYFDSNLVIRDALSHAGVALP